MTRFKRILAALFAVVLLALLCACGSSEPCISCRRTPTKAYKNEYTGETEYYCSTCSSDCAFCSKTASRHYSSWRIIFVCDECYKEIQDLNS